MKDKFYLNFNIDSEFFQWDLKHLRNYIFGMLITSIGAGNFREELEYHLNMYAAWCMYVQDKNEKR